MRLSRLLLAVLPIMLAAHPLLVPPLPAAIPAARETTAPAPPAVASSCWVRLNDDPTDYLTVQAAVDASTSPTDIVKVAGYCASVSGRHGVTQTVYLSKTLTVQGGYTLTNWTAPDPVANPTTLDALGQGRTFYLTGEISPSIAGLRITGGDATTQQETGGGGLYGHLAAITISNCTIFSNSADVGGGLYLYQSRATLTANTFSTNTAHYTGGGAHVAEGSTILTGNAIRSNTADTGGGLYLHADVATLAANSFTANHAVHDGGGVIVEVYSAEVTLTANLVAANTAGWNGGGLYFGEPVASRPGAIPHRTPTAAHPTPVRRHLPILFSGNRILSNTAQLHGGGVFMGGDGGTPLLEGNVIEANTALADGGGVYLDWSSEPAAISENHIGLNVAQGNGGGIYLGIDDATLLHNVVRSNLAWQDGGGVHGQGVFTANTLISNTAYADGGGLYGGGRLEANLLRANTAAKGAGLYLHEAIMTNNVVVDNQANLQGSGIYISGLASRLLHTTLAGNVGGDGSGIHVSGEGGHDSTVSLTNTILVSHAVGITVTAGSTVTLQGTLWGNDVDWAGPGHIVTGTANTWGSPGFVDPASGDYHISITSAAIDQGVATEVATDIDGQVRPAGWNPDLGADEYPDYILFLLKQAQAEVLNPGQVFSYTLQVTSSGWLTVTHVAISDRLPLHQQALTITADQGSCLGLPGWGGGAACDLGDLPPGAIVHMTLTAQVTTTRPPTLPLPMLNSVSVTATETANRSQVETYLQDCHVRLNDDVHEYTTVQDAVDASRAPTDVVKVAGICAGVRERDGLRQQAYLTRTLIIRGGYDAAFSEPADPAVHPTILDALGWGRVLFISGPGHPTVEGLRLSGGDPAGQGGHVDPWGQAQDAGGGAYLVSTTATISNCAILSNTAYLGGGAYLGSSAATVVSSTIAGNHAYWGGGLYLADSAATVARNRIEANSAYYLGGGLDLERCPAGLQGNTITANSGWGLYLGHSSATLDQNVVSANTGGGLYLDWSPALLAGNTFQGNTGPGLRVYRSDALLSNNVIAENEAPYSRGDGLYLLYSSPRLVHTTITRNRGDGLYLSGSSTVFLTNTLLVSHTIGLYADRGSSAVLEATLWGSGSWGNGSDWDGAGTISTGTVNLWGDPAFVDPDAGNYHLAPASAAVDAGVDAGTRSDIDGDPRPIGPGYDIGADEFPAAVTLAKWATPDPVAPGAQLTFTLKVTNAGSIVLTATVSDYLPAVVTPTGMLTWVVPIAPGGDWTGTAVVQVSQSYTGTLTNTLRVTTEQGVGGVSICVVTVTVPEYRIYLPLVRRG